MTEHYQKVAYIAFDNKDGSIMITKIFIIALGKMLVIGAVVLMPPLGDTT